MYKKFISLPYVAILVFLAGCATIPRETLNIPTFNISGKEYYSLKSLCDFKSINWSWDGFTGVVSLKKDNLEARVLVGEPIAQINGKAIEIKSVPIFYKGAVVVPIGFDAEVIAKLIKIMSAKEKQVPCIVAYPINKVVIDAGHGGKDPGAIGRSGLKEKDITLDVAKRLRDEFEQRGIDTVMTRESNNFVSLSRRCNIANASGADLFISVHANANRARRIQGFEIYCLREASDSAINKLANSGDSEHFLKDLAFDHSSKNVRPILLDMIYTENRSEALGLARCISASATRELSLKNRGIKGANFFVLKNTYIPAILIEIGYVSNSAEERYLRSSFYRQQLAEAITKGLMNFQNIRRLGLRKK